MKTQRLHALALGLLASGVLMILLWAWSLTGILTTQLYDHLCLEMSGSSFELINGTASPTWTDHGLDIWHPYGAMKHMHKYNYLLNKNAQPMTTDPTNPSSITQWWQAASMIAWYLKSPPRYDCSRLRWYGNWGVCQDKKYSVQTPCLVYSFGIDFDFRFDDAIGKLGCDVRSFDPRGTSWEVKGGAVLYRSYKAIKDGCMGWPNNRRKKNVRFYAYGLGSSNTNSYVPMLGYYVTKPQIWKVRTLAAIRKELGHSGRVLDVLKLDIEAWEWRVIDNIMETNLHKYIRHLLVEYHLFAGGILPPKDYLVAFQIHTRLRQLGFLEYLSNPHSELFAPNAYNIQGEVFYINSRFNLTNDTAGHFL